MANNQNNTQIDIPWFILKKARERKLYLATEMAQAKKRIPSKYHDFLIFLPQNEKIGVGQNGMKYNITPEGYELGIYYVEKGSAFYMSIEKPYVTVDGRLQMLRDEHEAAGKFFKVHPPIIVPYNEGLTAMSVTIESELYGCATGLIEIGSGSANAVDRSNPLSNAQTSAIGRALGFLGYGLIGTGVVFSEDELADLNQAPSKPPVNNNASDLVTNTVKPFILIVGTFQINPDNSSTCVGVMEDKKQIKVVFPQEQVDFVRTLTDRMHVKVIGTFNAEKGILVVASKAQCSVIQPAGA